VLLQPLKQGLIESTLFRISKPHSSRPVPFKRTDEFGSLFPNHLDRIIYDNKFTISQLYFFPISCFSCYFKFSFNTQILPFICDCNHVIPLLVSCLLQEYKSSEQRYGQSELSLRSSFFWDVMQRRLVVNYRSFGTTYRSHLQGSSSLRNFGN